MSFHLLGPPHTPRRCLRPRSGLGEPRCWVRRGEPDGSALGAGQGGRWQRERVRERARSAAQSGRARAARLPPGGYGPHCRHRSPRPPAAPARARRGSAGWAGARPGAPQGCGGPGSGAGRGGGAIRRAGRNPPVLDPTSTKAAPVGQFSVPRALCPACLMGYANNQDPPFLAFEGNE